ncbi:MAG TPA: 30S ribosome-binding factor RbfA [Acidimicrobiia bacterium]|nr:30S ribosome-binding factor RbfA [Acidimicrobiia bacterium]
MTRRYQPRRYPRSARLNEVVREVLAEELARLSDPRLNLVTLTGVDVAADLRHAIVYYSQVTAKGKSPSDEEAWATMRALRSASRLLRLTLGKQVRMKYLPELVFRIDPAIEQGQRIEEIISRLHAGERAGPEPPPPPGEGV